LNHWQEVADISGEVLNSGIYTLEPDLNNVFIMGSNEAIWQLPVSGDYYETTEGYNMVPEADYIPHYDMTSELLNDFEQDDQRRINWVGEFELNGVFYYHPNKYKNRYPSSVGPEEDYMIFRLGELYLIRAEALAQLNRPDEALIELNTIRSRAGLPNLSFTDKETLLADIMQERRIELFVEWGNRWFDLKRTNKADAVLGASKPGWQPHDALYPIPLGQITTNPFLVQNPGY
jgi:hypothetical protein